MGGERAIINGHHDTPVFQTMLDKFIEKYVLCQKCHLPEIDMKIKKGDILAGCAACGWTGELDNNHKLAAFIIKNPPDETGHGVVNLAEGAGDGKSKRDKRAEREAKRKAKEDGSGEEEDDDEDDDDAKKDKKEKKGEERQKRQKRQEGKEGEEGEESRGG